MSTNENANVNGSLICLHANVSLCRSLGGNLGTNLYKLKKVKIEGTMSSWVDPLYDTPPIIIFDKKQHVFWNQFIEQYHICGKGPSPKCLKLGKDFEEVEVEALFGPSISRNGYQYSWSNDEVLIVEVENLWMIAHQRTQIPNTLMINKVEAQGFGC